MEVRESSFVLKLETRGMENTGTAKGTPLFLMSVHNCLDRDTQGFGFILRKRCCQNFSGYLEFQVFLR